MPIVAHNSLPTFERLRQEGVNVLAPDRALHQDIRELHIGFLNMMPDAALEATERQFIRLVGGCNRIAQFFVYPFSLDGLPRSADTRDYIARYYSRFDELRESGLDALIITGANVANPALEDEPELVNSDPYGDGWLLRLQLADSGELEGLLVAEAYEALQD